MLYPMKTTLIIPAPIMRELERQAARRGETLAAVVAETLRRGLAAQTAADLPPLPVHCMGRAAVDIADRDAIYGAMEG